MTIPSSLFVDSIIGIEENGHDMYYHYQYIHNMDRSSVLRGFTSRGQPPMHKLCPYFVLLDTFVYWWIWSYFTNLLMLLFLDSICFFASYIISYIFIHNGFVFLIRIYLDGISFLYILILMYLICVRGLVV